MKCKNNMGERQAHKTTLQNSPAKFWHFLDLHIFYFQNVSPRKLYGIWHIFLNILFISNTWFYFKSNRFWQNIFPALIVTPSLLLQGKGKCSGLCWHPFCHCKSHTWDVFVPYIWGRWSSGYPRTETSGTTSRWCCHLSPRGRHQSTARASLAPVQLPRGLSTAQGHWTHKRFIYSISLPAVHLHYCTSCTELQHKSGKHTMADVELGYKSIRSPGSQTARLVYTDEAFSLDF